MDELLNTLFKGRLVVTIKEITQALRISELTVRRRIKAEGSVKPLGGGPHGYRLTREQVRRLFP